MKVVEPIRKFRVLCEEVRNRVPSYDEYPERISEAEAQAYLHSIRNSARSNAEPAKQWLNIGQMALLGRALCLPDADAAQESLLAQLDRCSGMTMYLMLRGMLQYHPMNHVLVSAFSRVAVVVRSDGNARRRLLSLQKSDRDLLMDLCPDQEPIRLLLEGMLDSKTLFGVFTADQGILRKSLLFKLLREAFFSCCPSMSFALDVKEWCDCVSTADDTAQTRMLGHFLTIFMKGDFPYQSTRALIDLFGPPEEDGIWHHAVSDALDRSSAEQGRIALMRWNWLEQMKCHWQEVAMLEPDGSRLKNASSISGLHAFEPGVDAVKVDVFARFLPQMQKLSFDTEHQAMLADFGSVTVIDFKSAKSFAWVCDSVDLKSRYETLVKMMLNQDEQEVGYRKRNRILEARDFVIEQENGTVIRLTFAEVGKLYAIDMLSIRLGLMAPEQWGVM